MTYIKCNTCRGSGELIGLGQMIIKCHDCGGTRFRELDVIVTPNVAHQDMAITQAEVKQTILDETSRPNLVKPNVLHQLRSKLHGQDSTA